MTAPVRGLPPGRAGRLWLRRRLALAERGGELLEQKLRILRAEEDRFTLRCERTAEEWAAAVRDLDVWTVRAALLSGERGLRLARCGDRPAVADVSWRLTMGVRYPSAVAVRLPPTEPADPVPDNSALLHARTAAERVVQAGAEHAVATTALAAIRAEIATTARQVRALQDRWVPRLEAARNALDVALDDQEHEDGVRLRWASARGRESGRAP